MNLKFYFCFFFSISLQFLTISTKSQDYGRHIMLSLLFYECQRSGKLPETNRIYWRHDTMLDAGADEGVDLTGGYYDAGDNVKFNFPMASALTLLAWSGIEFSEGYKKADQWEIFLDTVKWGTDYLLKCHAGKNVLYVGVGKGGLDHGYWCAPEYINYEYPSYKVTESDPGSDVAAETSAALTATSILFKEIDPSYSDKCLKAAKEIYEFADTYRGEYTQATGFYNSFSGYRDELAWGAVWLYKATGDETYHDKFKAIADFQYEEQDTKKYLGCPGPISWDDKRPGCYVLISQITGDKNRTQVAYDYCDMIISSPTTSGGLYYDGQLSQWASNRYAANAAAIVALFANMLPESDQKRERYIKWVKSQIDYILGDNPAGVNYVVGAEENSPKSVHHRAASGTCDASGKPSFNIYTLYGALAGGPGKDDSYTDSRINYQMNEVALDYNAGFTLDLAALLHFGYGVKDSGDILNFDRAWPPKPPKTPDIKIEMDNAYIYISTGSGMICSSWCISFNSETEIDSIMDCMILKNEPGSYTLCNKRETAFLDGEGTPQKIHIDMDYRKRDNFTAPPEYEVLCDGFHADQMSAKDYMYIPEYGHKYKVIGTGGPGKTEPLYEKTDCWPSYVC